MNVDLLEKIEAVGSKLEKERLLAQADGELRLFLEQCLDPDITYGVTADEVDYVQRRESTTQVIFWNAMKELLNALALRQLTGNAAILTMDKTLRMAPDRVTHKWAIRFINKNLRAGFDIRTYNKVFGDGTVKKFAVQLADIYEAQELDGIWYIQPKLDGNRVILIDGKAMSRNGKEYPNCEHVIDELLEKDADFFKKWVLDGEMMGDLGFDKSSGALRRINEKNREKATFTYYCFDIIDRKEWELRKTQQLSVRKNKLEELLVDLKTLKIVPTQVVRNPTHSQIMVMVNDYVADGFEGAMIKDPGSPYVFKRGKNLLKAKLFFDQDFEVIGFYEGKGRHKGRLGGVIVEGEYEGIKIQSRVGSGFDDAIRDEIWGSRTEWMGAIVQVQFQEATKDGSLRFPVFIMRRKDKE